MFRALLVLALLWFAALEPRTEAEATFETSERAPTTAQAPGIPPAEAAPEPAREAPIRRRAAESAARGAHAPPPAGRS